MCVFLHSSRAQSTVVARCRQAGTQPNPNINPAKPVSLSENEIKVNQKETNKRKKQA